MKERRRRDGGQGFTAEWAKAKTRQSASRRRVLTCSHPALVSTSVNPASYPVPAAMLPPLSAFARSALLPTRRTLTAAPLMRARLLHATRPALASEPTSLGDLKNHPMLQKISGSPDAMAAIYKFVGLLQSKGACQPTPRLADD
jgi:hypothetical protein